MSSARNSSYCCYSKKNVRDKNYDDVVNSFAEQTRNGETGTVQIGRPGIR